MESSKRFWIIVIVMVSMLVTFLTPMVESKSVPLRDSNVARSLLSVSVSPPSESPSPSPAPGPEVENTIAIPASSPTEIDIDSPSPSPGASISPANAPTTSSPSPSPEAPVNAPRTDSPSPSPEVNMDSPSPSPEASEESTSPANTPTESLSPSLEVFEEDLEAPSGKTLMSSTTKLLKEPLLSPEIKTICSKTDNPELCESSISPLLTAAVKPDASSVLVLAIQASINATKAVIPTVNKVAASDCQELYDDAMANLEDSITAVKGSDIATVSSNLSAAMTDIETCNDGFEESGEPNPLAEVSDKLKKMVSNCLAISSLIK